MKNPWFSSVVGFVTLALFLTGCKGEDPRPTLDYAPENVEKIREVQGLEMPASETGEASPMAEGTENDASNEDSEE